MSTMVTVQGQEVSVLTAQRCLADFVDFTKELVIPGDIGNGSEYYNSVMQSGGEEALSVHQALATLIKNAGVVRQSGIPGNVIGYDLTGKVDGHRIAATAGVTGNGPLSIVDSWRPHRVGLRYSQTLELGRGGLFSGSVFLKEPLTSEACTSISRNLPELVARPALQRFFTVAGEIVARTVKLSQQRTGKPALEEA